MNFLYSFNQYNNSFSLLLFFDKTEIILINVIGIVLIRGIIDSDSLFISSYVNSINSLWCKFLLFLSKITFCNILSSYFKTLFPFELANLNFLYIFSLFHKLFILLYISSKNGKFTHISFILCWESSKCIEYVYLSINFELKLISLKSVEEFWKWKENLNNWVSIIK